MIKPSFYVPRNAHGVRVDVLSNGDIPVFCKNDKDANAVMERLSFTAELHEQLREARREIQYLKDPDLAALQDQLDSLKATKQKLLAETAHIQKQIDEWRKSEGVA